MATTLSALRRSHHPSFYDGRHITDEPTLCRGLKHIILLSLLISLPTSISLLLRCMPALVGLHWPTLFGEAERIFPKGLELVLNGSQLMLRPEPAAFGAAASSSSTAAGEEEEEEARDSYVCWSSGDESVEEEDGTQTVTPGQQWCALAPQLEPIRFSLPPVCCARQAGAS